MSDCAIRNLEPNKLDDASSRKIPDSPTDCRKSVPVNVEMVPDCVCARLAAATEDRSEYGLHRSECL